MDDSETPNSGTETETKEQVQVDSENEIHDHPSCKPKFNAAMQIEVPVSTKPGFEIDTAENDERERRGIAENRLRSIVNKMRKSTVRYNMETARLEFSLDVFENMKNMEEDLEHVEEDLPISESTEDEDNYSSNYSDSEYGETDGASRGQDLRRTIGFLMRQDSSFINIQTLDISNSNIRVVKV